jgi:PAS domain S-box-containing protein
VNLLASKGASRVHYALLERIDEPALVLDRAARLVWVNPAAARELRCRAGQAVAELSGFLSEPGAQWARGVAATVASEAHWRPESASLRVSGLSWQRLDAGCGALFVSLAPDFVSPQSAPELMTVNAAGLAPPADIQDFEQWLALTADAVVVFEPDGRILRCNSAWRAWLEPEAAATPDATASQGSVLNAPAEVPELLGFGSQRHGQPHWQQAVESVEPGQQARTGLDVAPIQGEGWIRIPGLAPRRVRARMQPIRRRAGVGVERVLAILQDCGVEQERDLALLQIGALMDATEVGLATFRQSSGWVPQRALRARADAGGGRGGTAVQSIRRELVLPESMPDYDRLQEALRDGRRAEVRFAIRHPELGVRWLLTRVEPDTLGSGELTTSVVTLDITEKRQAQLRSEQLLHELSTILESSTAGMAYVRDDVLMRCNARFVALVAAGRTLPALEGRTLESVFAGVRGAAPLLTQLRAALRLGRPFETETAWVCDEVAPLGRPAAWYALSVRRSGDSGRGLNAVVVLSDITRLKTQQLQLEEAARDRELMFSLSDVGIAFLRDGRIERANQTLAQWMACSPQALSGRAEESLFAGPSGAEDRRLAREQLLANGRWTGERQLRQGDGRALWVQVSHRQVDAHDPAAGVIASYVNVDARVAAEQALTLQAERTRAILDSVLVGIVTVGSGGIEWMNRSARRMFGGDLADFINQPISTVATPDPAHPFRQTQYLSELVEGQAETFECQLQARDGREFWVVGNAVATGRERRGRQLTYALLDIERRRQAEARTAQAQASLARVIEAAPMALALMDAGSLHVLQINAVASELVGQPAAEIVNHPLEALLPSARGALSADMRAAAASGELMRREYHFDHQGQARIWDARLLPLASPDGGSEQLLMVASDVTEQRMAQEARFEAAISQRDMLVKEVHHRIKNNLQGVAGLMRQIAQSRPEVAGIISEVVGQVQAIAQVYGLQVGSSGPLRVKPVVEAITASVQRTFGRTIILEVLGSETHAWALPEAESIPIALTLNELLTNAIKHSPAPCEVSCIVETDADGVVLSVLNHGSLPEGFNLAQVPGGVSGLGLVRALLPRRSAKLSLTPHGSRVLARIQLNPPSVARLEPL